MHLETSDYMDMTTDRWIPKNGHVTTETVIGTVGGFVRRTDGTVKQLVPHLHFEVWRKDNDKWVLHDPYGKYDPDGNMCYDTAWK